MNDSFNRKIGAFLQFVQVFLSIIISVAFTSYMLDKLGQEEYGVFSVCTSTIGYLSLLSLGLNSSYIRYYTRARKKLDGISVEELNWHYIVIFSFFGIVSFVIGLAFGFNAGVFFNDSYSAGDIEKAEAIMKILAINMAISFPATVFSSYITSQQRFIFLKLVNVIKTVCSPLAQFILLFLGYGSIGMAIITTAVNLLADVINLYYCVRVLDMKFQPGRMKGIFIKQIASFSVFIGINQIVNQINFSADKLILSKLANSAHVAAYSVAATLNGHFEQVGSSIANLFDPKINKIIASDKDHLTKNQLIDEIFIKVGRVQFYILMLITTGFLFFGRFFIHWWAGNEYDDSYFVTLLLIFPLCIPLLQNTAVYVQRAKYKHKFRSFLYLCTSILNVFISMGFVLLWGAIGAALGTTLTLIINSVVINIYYKRVIELDVFSFWKNIFSVSKGLVLPAIWGIASWFVFPCEDILSFIINVVIYTIVYIVSIYLFSFNGYEKSLVLKVKRKVIKK